MIRRVRIRNYKSLRDVQVTLHALSVIIGPNAVGKSNLFDALGLVSRMVTKPSLKEAFADHRGSPIEAFSLDRGLTALLEAGSAQFSMQVDVELSPQVMAMTEELIRDMRAGLDADASNGKRRIVERFLRYEVEVEILTETGLLRVRNEKLSALTKDGRERRSRNPFIERMHERIHVRMEGQGHPTYYQVGLDHTVASTSLYTPHHPHVSAFRDEVSRWRFYYLEPKSMRAENDLKPTESLGSYGADLAAFYNTLKQNHPRQFDVVNRTLRQILPSVEKVDVERTDEGLLRLIVVERGVSFSARVVSEGTLRILGLLAITNPVSPATVVGYEEPENGVHPRRLSLIADLLAGAASRGDCQYLVNTHSAILPEYFDDRDLILCRKEQGGTEFVRFPVREPLLKKQNVEAALEEDGVGSTSFSERIIRGDYGG